jgi:hypothetical protein
MSSLEEASPLGAQWFPVGLASTFPDLGYDEENLAKYRACGGAELKPGCKVFQVPRDDSSQRAEIEIREDGTLQRSEMKGLKDQVLVFQYKGKFHAVDHVSPSCNVIVKEICVEPIMTGIYSRNVLIHCIPSLRAFLSTLRILALFSVPG